MTIPLDADAGSLFNRLGYWAAGLDDINAFRGGAATARVLAGAIMPDRVADLEAAYGTAPINSAVIDGIFSQLTSFQSSLGSFLSYTQQRCQSTMIEMADQDTPLASKDLRSALALLIQQMTTNSESVNASAPSAGAQTAVGTPNGNVTIVVSVKNANGTLAEYAFPEKLTFVCTADSQGSATLNRESLSVRGEAARADTLSHLWPDGSGASLSLTAVDAGLNNSGGNLLQNSDFEDFTTTNHPDNWTIVAGAAGTTIFNGGSGDAYDGSGSLEFTGDAGGTLIQVTQAFNTTPVVTVNAGGTAGRLLPLTQYALNCWIKCSATPTAGVLEFSLIDGTPATINDAAGTANLFTRTLTTVSTTWINVTGTFRTPAVLPAVQKLKIRLSTAIDDTKSVFIDRLALSAMTIAYPGGPWVCAFSDSADKLILGDTWTVTISNTYGEFQKFFERVFGMRQLGLQLPSDSAAAETILDSLIG